MTTSMQTKCSHPLCVWDQNDDTSMLWVSESQKKTENLHSTNMDVNTMDEISSVFSAVTRVTCLVTMDPWYYNGWPGYQPNPSQQVSYYTCN